MEKFAKFFSDLTACCLQRWNFERKFLELLKQQESEKCSNYLSLLK